MSAVFYTESCNCGSKVKYQLVTSEIHLYNQEKYHHLAVHCLKGHPILVFTDMSWLEAAQKRVPGQRLKVNMHTDPPADIRAAAQAAWAHHDEREDLEKELERFGQTGQFF